MNYTCGEYGEFSVSLRIAGEGVRPSVITLLLGVKPSRGWEKGDTLPSGVVASFGCWALESECTDSIDVGSHVAWLLERMPDSLDEIHRTVPDAEKHVSVALRAFNDNRGPILAFDGPLLSRLVRLGLDLDIDMYCTDPPATEH